jgi:hypothetical protein
LFRTFLHTYTMLLTILTLVICIIYSYYFIAMGYMMWDRTRNTNIHKFRILLGNKYCIGRTLNCSILNMQLFIARKPIRVKINYLLPKFTITTECVTSSDYSLTTRTIPNSTYNVSALQVRSYVDRILGSTTLQITSHKAEKKPATFLQNSNRLTVHFKRSVFRN